MFSLLLKREPEALLCNGNAARIKLQTLKVPAALTSHKLCMLNAEQGFKTSTLA